MAVKTTAMKRVRTYRHGRDKVGLTLLEPKAPRYDITAKERNKRLDHEYKWYNGQIGQFFRRQLGAEFHEDWEKSY